MKRGFLLGGKEKKVTEMTWDVEIKRIAISPFIKIIRPIEFDQKDRIPSNGLMVGVGNVRYVYENPYENIAILFMGAIKINNWIITLEKNLKTENSCLIICGFFKNTYHCSFKKIETKDAYAEFFDFVHSKILPLMPNYNKI
jgi:hypothetical protein